MASQGMMLRNMALVGQTAHVTMPAHQKYVFEEGVNLIFSRWTALQLAVANEWGGSTSRQKAQELLEDVIQWFYTSKECEPCDLEDMLEDALQTDFNVQAEDDSPYQVSRSLVNMHNQVASGDRSYVETLRLLQPVSAAVCQKENAPPDPEADSSSSSDEDEEDGMGRDGADEMDMDDGPVAGAGNQPAQTGPIIDEDGFELVQRKGRGRR